MIIKLFKSSGVLIRFTSIFAELGTISGRADNDNGFNDVITKPFTSGDKIGPPADKEYAVEPFDVEIINPSALFL